MTCQRCKGLMVEDRFFDLLDSSSQNIPAWRCVICGEVTDMTIVNNRSVQSRTNDRWSARDLSRIP
ncbi:MAG: hypothetical protein L0H94_12215 [Nitrospira sp.]|nr:hypothetical protein [Nitrospira sp.]